MVFFPLWFFLLSSSSRLDVLFLLLSSSLSSRLFRCVGWWALVFDKKKRGREREKERDSTLEVSLRKDKKSPRHLSSVYTAPRARRFPRLLKGRKGNKNMKRNESREAGDTQVSMNSFSLSSDSSVSQSDHLIRYCLASQGEEIANCLAPLVYMCPRHALLQKDASKMSVSIYM